MPHRDPSTGQFVADDSALHYDDLEKQRVSVESEFDPGGSDPAASMNLLFDSLATFEPAGGLDRGELAELVGYEVEASTWVRGNNSDEAQIVSHWELSEDSNALYPGLLTNSFNGVTSFDGTSRDGTTTDFDTATGGPDHMQVNEDVIHHIRETYASGGFDTGTGTGAGDNNGQTVRDENWYRDHMAHGPVYDRHNEFHVHFLGSILNNNHKARSGYISDLYWNVTEDDR